ncbi:MAG: cytochrome c biogenesis protein CcsA [Firmicutes bacterium]|nr:cytochrome c biogenesis protein CcsA [Bacillota bacterium]
MRYVGILALLVMIGLSIYTAYSYYVGNKIRKGEKQQKAASWGMIWQFVISTFASLVLLAAFINDDFTFGYVAEHSTRTMNIFYKISAFWAGHEGSLLLWIWMLSGYTAVLAYFNLKKTDKLKSQALYISNYVQLALLITTLAFTNPFKAADPQFAMMGNGVGLNPLLMHWAMVLHPPTLFMGYAGLTIPFAFAIAALIERDASNNWINQARGWTLFAWLFLTIGIWLGALWAYVVLGWGGFWGWDPVENASILPWLTGTALLHTFTIYRRRGGMKVWAVSLASLSFIMCVMATFITRSGLISSVHAFPDVRGDLVFAFGSMMVVATGLTLYLVNTRKQEFETQEFFNDFLSRHFTYYLNNFMLVVFTTIILLATVGGQLMGTEVKPAFYNALAQPLGLVYLLLLTICPYLGWTKTDGGKLLKQLIVPTVAAAAAAVLLATGWTSIQWTSKPWGFATIVAAVFSFVAVIQIFFITVGSRAKNRGVGFLTSLGSTIRNDRSLTGGYIGHLGMAIMFFGIAGSMLYVQETQPTLPNKAGSTVQAGDYQLVYKGLQQSQVPGEQRTDAIFNLIDSKNGGKLLGVVRPQITYHEVQQQQTAKASIYHQPFRDIFVVLNGIDNQGILALTVKVNPLISFVWIGSVILVFGTVIAMWPRAISVAEETEHVKKKKATGKKKKELVGAST